MNGGLEPTAELSLKDAAILVGVTEKTLRRDNDSASSPIAFIKRDGHNYVTVQMLIDAGRYVARDESAATAAECAQLRDRVEQLLAERGELQQELSLSRALHAQAVDLFRMMTSGTVAPILKAVK